MISVICPGSMSYDASNLDQQFRDLTNLFGLYSGNTYASDPNAYFDDGSVQRRGTGPSQRCQRSGNKFPASRLKRDGDGRLVGDIFWTSGTPRRHGGSWR
jgi:hypothetical protein